MNYSQISYGSRGDDVKKLQELLNQNGYSLDVDGSFGPKTREAVKDYQTKNSLKVDGIVGTNTWGALTGSTNSTNSAAGSTTQAGAATQGTGANTGFDYGAYQESDAVQQAYALLQEQMGSKPGEYQSSYADQIQAILDQIMNREKFSYDLNGDALYQQYRDQYARMGNMAMMDTMGQAAAMTGGYGNSYAQSAGQQAYQSYLQQLNDVVPELYGMALDQYNREGQNMLDQYALLAGQEEQDYGRYRDAVSDYYARLQAAYDQYNAERDYDYSQWADGRDFAYGQYSDDRAYDYQEGRDKVSDEQWQKEYDEMVRQYNQQYAASQKASSGGGSSGGSGGGSKKSSSSGSGYNNGSLSADQVKALQKALGVSADGKYGPGTKKAAGGLSAEEAYKKYVGGSGGGDGGSNTSGFTGTTYSEAVAYLKANGVQSSEASFPMNQSEWQRRKNSYQMSGQGSSEVKNYDTYAEYLADYVAYCVETYGG